MWYHVTWGWHDTFMCSYHGTYYYYDYHIHISNVYLAGRLSQANSRKYQRMFKNTWEAYYSKCVYTVGLYVPKK